MEADIDKPPREEQTAHRYELIHEFLVGRPEYDVPGNLPARAPRSPNFVTRDVISPAMPTAAAADVLVQEEILLAVAKSGLTTKCLLTLNLVSRTMHGVSKAVLRHLLSPNRFLGCFFPDTTVLYNLVENGEMMVTGAPVLRYMSNLRAPINELVLLVAGPRLDGLLSCLGSFGWSVQAQSRDKDDTDARHAMRETYCLRRSGSRVNIWVQVPRLSLFQGFLSQRTTFFLNAFYRTMFFSLYPAENLSDRVGFMLNVRRVISIDGQKKAAEPGGNPAWLERFGYSFVADGVPGGHTALAEQTRYVGDRWTWISSAATSAEEGLKEDDFMLQGWSLSARTRRSAAMGLGAFAMLVDSEVVDSPILGGPFVVPSGWKDRVTGVIEDESMTGNLSRNAARQAIRHLLEQAQTGGLATPATGAV